MEITISISFTQCVHCRAHSIVTRAGTTVVFEMTALFDDFEICNSYCLMTNAQRSHCIHGGVLYIYDICLYCTLVVFCKNL